MSFTPTGPTEVRRVTAPGPPPAVVESPFVGRLEFAGGFPTEATLQRVYDQLDFQRACQVFLRHLLGASMYAFREGLRRDLGATTAQDFVHLRLDARGLLLTGNSETVYGTTFLDLKADGPTVLEVPPRVLGFLNDLWMRPLGDLGLAGPDAGAGGKYLVVPPGYADELPAAGDEGYRGGRALADVPGVVHPAGLPGGGRGRRPGGGHAARGARLPLDAARRTAGDALRRRLGRAVRHDPPRRRALLRAPGGHDRVRARGRRRPGGRRPGWRSWGSTRGRPSPPTPACAGSWRRPPGSAARWPSPCQRAPGPHRMYPDRQWFDHIPGYPAFRDARGRPLVDAMAQMAWFATGRAQAMGHPRPGTGSAYTWTYRDAAGAWLDPARTYRLRLLAPVPAKDFWSVVVYDLWTRSMLANGQPYPSVNSYAPGLRANADGAIDLYLGPRAPAGFEANWIRTLPGTGWFPILRLYGPTEPWFDQTWTPGDLEPVDG